MADTEQHYAAMQELNRDYIRSVDEADVAWFDANLAADFFNTNPNGTSSTARPFLRRSVAAPRSRNPQARRDHPYPWRCRHHPRAHQYRRQMVPRGPAATPMTGGFATDAGNASRHTSRASEANGASSVEALRRRAAVWARLFRKLPRAAAVLELSDNMIGDGEPLLLRQAYIEPAYDFASVAQLVRAAKS